MYADIIVREPSPSLSSHSPFIDRGDAVGVRSCAPLLLSGEDTDMILLLFESKVGERMAFSEILAEDPGPLTIDRRAWLRAGV